MRILALNPFATGSHLAFFRGWAATSHHHWTHLDLPGQHWKLRMRTAPIELARMLQTDNDNHDAWDIILTTDMLDVAQFKGLAPAPLAHIPCVAYFHENQLTYPSRLDGDEAQRDLHFAFTNITTALASDGAWFNSQFNRDSFLGAIERLNARLPGHPLASCPRTILEKSRIENPGIDPLPERAGQRTPGPLRICWAHRWEHDKGPRTLLRAIQQLRESNVPFRLDVIGESYDKVPQPLYDLHSIASDNIGRWGYQPSRGEYARALAEADVFLSTAAHEFFGIATVEAVHAGCFPLVPRHLAYPEVLAGALHHSPIDPFHDNAPGTIAQRLIACARRIESGASLFAHPDTTPRAEMQQYLWAHRAPQLDAALEQVAAGHAHAGLSR